jgi:hypothetical protein
MTDKKTGLDKMREPFTANQISKLPKPTKEQTESVKRDYKQGFRCPDCNGWHHPKVVHLDYVGHAALTDRLLECDIQWSYRPLATTDVGLPAFDKDGGLWIELTVCGVTRLGYGNAYQKPAYGPGDREKEVIGDALRNAGMRFGAALDLWHKGDLHYDEIDESTVKATKDELREHVISDAQWTELVTTIDLAGVMSNTIMAKLGIASLKDLPADKFASVMRKLNLTINEKLDDKPKGDAND